MPIIALKDGTHINSAHVVQFTHQKNGETRFLLSTGGEKISEVYSKDDLELMFFPVIASVPGFVAVSAERTRDSGFLYQKRTVIAWRLTGTGNYPVFEGCSFEEYAHEYEVVVDPCGVACDADGNQYSSLDEWMAEFEASQSTAQAA